MGFMDWLRPSPSSVVVPLTTQEVQTAARTFEFQRIWTCRCGAQLKIRAREDRSSGPSNFTAYPKGHLRAGHATLPSLALTWAGLAEERGWQTDPVRCPACQRGMTVASYKHARRDGEIA
jgi:hypothetical protein